MVRPLEAACRAIGATRALLCGSFGRGLEFGDPVVGGEGGFLDGCADELGGEGFEGPFIVQTCFQGFAGYFGHDAWMAGWVEDGHGICEILDPILPLVIVRLGNDQLKA